jgi:acetyl esterase/lipase
MAQVTVLDTVYTPAGYPDSPLSARIHIPDPVKSRGIGIVMTHGYTAPQTGNQFWRDSLVAHGYLVMAVVHPDMNVAPDGLYPKLVRAAKTAVQFLRQNADLFRITTGKIVGWGQSQGAMVWGQTIIWDNDHQYFGTNPALNDHIDAAILLYGLYDMYNWMPAWVGNLLTTHFSADPTLRGTKGQCLSNVANITTPVLLVHATGDPTVYINHSRMLRDSLNWYGRSLKLIEFNSSSHTFDALSDTQFSTLGLAAKDSALAFLNSILSPLSVKEYADGVPAAFALEQNYPNPFNPATVISYHLPFTIHHSLKIYDLLGREVAVLVDGEKPAGTHSATWDAAGLPSGMYFYRLTTNKFVETKRLLLVR